MAKLAGYKTYSMAIAVVITQIVGLLPMEIDPEIINALSVMLGVLVVAFNYSGRKRLTKGNGK